MRTFVLGLLLCLPLSAASRLYAQNEPKITILFSSPDRLYEDFESLFKLTSEAEQKEYKAFKDYLDLMAEGLDMTLPMRYDVITEGNKTRYRPGFGIADKDGFLSNLNAFGIKTKRLLKDYYSLSGAFEGFLRFVDEDKTTYAIIGEEKDDVPRGFVVLDATMKQYALMPDGKTAKEDIFALLINDTPNFEARRTSYKKVKDEIMAGVSQKEGETTPNFELRKGLLALQIDELGRYYTDSKEMTIGWTTDAPKKHGQLKFGILPIAGTPLEKTINASGTTPSYFTALTAPENAVLAGAIFMPLDDQQRVNIREVFRLLKGRLESEVKEAQDETPEQKAAFQEMLNEFDTAVADGLKTDSVDGFIHIWPNEGGKHTAVGGLMMSEAEKMLNVLKEFQIARPKSKVELDIEKVGDVAIHSVVLSEEHQASMDDFFGSHTVYIGIGPNAVWYAVGAEGLEGLKSRIQTVIDAKDVQPNKNILSVKLQAAPFIAWRNRHADPPDESQKNKMPIRQFMVDSIVDGEDLLTMELVQKGEGAEGVTNVGTGYLRFVGKILARFSKETLAE